MANEAKGAEIARAYVLVIPSTQGAQKQLTEELVPQAEKASEEAGHKSGTAFCSKMAKSIAAGAAAVAAAAATLVAGVVSAAQDVAALGDAIDKQSQKVGLSYEAYQKWDYVMQLAGTSMQACTTGMKTLTNKFDDAIQGGAGATETFARLGISMEEIQGLSRQDVFAKVVKALQNVTDETKKAALANDLFGKSGQDLLPLFNMTNEELDQLMAETEAYGMIMSDEAVKDAAEFTDSLTKLDKTMQGLKTSMVSKFLPGLTLITDGLAGMAAGIEGSADKVASGVADMVSRIAKMVPEALRTIGKLIPQLSQVILDNIPALVGAVVDTLDTLVSFITSDDNLQNFVNAAIDIALALVAAVPRIINALAPAIPQIVEGVVGGIMENLPAFITAAIDIVTGLVAAIPQIISGLIEAIPTIVDKLVAAFTDESNQQKMVEAGKALGQALLRGFMELVIPGLGSFEDRWASATQRSWTETGQTIDLGGYDWLSTQTSGSTTIYTGDVSVTANSAAGFAASLRAASAMGR